MEIQTKQYNNVSEFLDENETQMLKNESMNNLILGLSNSILKQERNAKSPMFLSVLDNSKIIGQAIRTDPEKPLGITDLSEEAIESLVKHLNKESIVLQSVIGPSISSEAFAAAYDEDNKLEMHQGVYEARSITTPPNQHQMSLIVVNEGRREKARDFMRGFIRDCFPTEKRHEEGLEEMLDRRIRNRSLHFLIDTEGTPCSMAALSRESRNASTLSLVYTPDHLRGKGYGSLVTALLSQKLIKRKPICNLYTDLLNPTSNSIYQKIGFKKVGESKHFSFK